MTDIDDTDAFREALGSLIEEAEQADVPMNAVTGLLTVYLARLRGDVRLPLGMPPERAGEFHATTREHIGETMQVELLITEDVLADIDLQLRAFSDDTAME